MRRHRIPPRMSALATRRNNRLTNANRSPTTMNDSPRANALRHMPTPVPFPAVLAVGLALASSPAPAAPPRDASVTARLGSCDAAVVRKGVDELLGDAKTLQ